MIYLCFLSGEKLYNILIICIIWENRIFLKNRGKLKRHVLKGIL